MRGKLNQLNPRQQAFVTHYARCGNASEAARLAGYSARTANRQGPALLSNPVIDAEVRRIRDGQLETVNVNAERVLMEYCRIGFSDIRNYFSWDEKGCGTYIPSDRLTPDLAAAIQSVKAETKTVTTSKGETYSTHRMQLKLWPKNPALDKLGEHLGLFESKDGEGGNAIRNELRTAFLAILAEMRGRMVTQVRPAIEVHGNGNGNGAG